MRSKLLHQLRRDATYAIYVERSGEGFAVAYPDSEERAFSSRKEAVKFCDEKRRQYVLDRAYEIMTGKRIY